jgi:hypothetical protein
MDWAQPENGYPKQAIASITASRVPEQRAHLTEPKSMEKPSTSRAGLQIDDPIFDRSITIREAYLALERVVSAHVSRGELSTVDFLTYVGITESGRSGDPAALADYLEAVEQVVGK